MTAKVADRTRIIDIFADQRQAWH